MEIMGLTMSSDGNIENFFVPTFNDIFMKISIISIVCFLHRHAAKTPKVKQTSFSWSM